MHYETAEILQSSEFENSCGCRIYREVKIKLLKYRRLILTAEFAFRQTSCIVCRFSLHYETAENKQCSKINIFSACLF
ncbi:hypothetical protein TPE_2531 [Treponema pedis str. T A4]|uniref:Uncharacterized protein n=1 Tax=Treponema pedis str. T A4 TaxID=1291379 RepID=S6A1Z7_9SPIR|nr:hypothetical protein TPE_2531 [Treponema pedis str. T A4]